MKELKEYLENIFPDVKTEWKEIEYLQQKELPKYDKKFVSFFLSNYSELNYCYINFYKEIPQQYQKYLSLDLYSFSQFIYDCWMVK